jgi:hypothetical protein
MESQYLFILSEMFESIQLVVYWNKKYVCILRLKAESWFNSIEHQ